MMTYVPFLRSLDLLPDTVRIPAGNDYQFILHVEDQYGQNLNVNPNWSASGGTIIGDGLYRAPASEGVYSIVVSALTGTFADTSRIYVTKALVSVDDRKRDDNPRQSLSILLDCYPNPSSSAMTIRFSIPKNDSQNEARTTLALFDLFGRNIATLFDGTTDTGIHELRFDFSKHIRGESSASSSVFFLRLRVNDRVVAKKVVWHPAFNR